MECDGIRLDSAHAGRPVTHVTAGPGGRARAGSRGGDAPPGRRLTCPFPCAGSVLQPPRRARLAHQPCTSASSTLPDRRLTIVRDAHIAHQKPTWTHIPGRDPTGLNNSPPTLGRMGGPGNTSEGLVTD